MALKLQKYGKYVKTKNQKVSRIYGNILGNYKEQSGGGSSLYLYLPLAIVNRIKSDIILLLVLNTEVVVTKNTIGLMSKRC